MNIPHPPKNEASAAAKRKKKEDTAEAHVQATKF